MQTRCELLRVASKAQIQTGGVADKGGEHPTHPMTTTVAMIGPPRQRTPLGGLGFSGEAR